MMDNLDVKRDDINYTHVYGDATKLMANAAKCVSDFITETFGKGIRICVVGGAGNNAGDGVAAAENLREENDVSVVLVKGRNSLKTGESRWALKSYGGRLSSMRSLEKALKEADVVVDAIFGVGISGEPREPYAKVIDMINRFGRNVVSVDVPSGLGTSKTVFPDYTVTFTDVKKGMTEENSGIIVVCDIGIPETVKNNAGPGDLVYFTEPEPGSHKGMNGILAIVGGWEYYGSAVIAALGANALAVDLVRIYVTEKNYQTIASYSPYTIVRDIDRIGVSWVDEALKCKAILVGPGLGLSENALKIIRSIVRKSKVPVIFDADGLKLLSGNLQILNGRQVVFTPHHREFEILSGVEATKENAVEFARRHSAIVVLKGMKDIVTDGSRVMYVTGGNARMTMGGTGDLLAGLISAVVSRGVDPFRAAVMGAYVNKQAAEYSYGIKSYLYVIDDMISAIPSIMKKNVPWASH